MTHGAKLLPGLKGPVGPQGPVGLQGPVGPFGILISFVNLKIKLA